ncbi:MAG: diguanylate cyclase [Lachnospiraceae bacterium]|nr:diguanylate cyclase [Lachnospiraceae bacterium]
MSLDTADWILVIDDDVTNLKIAGNILSKNGMRVTALNSGQAMLDFIAEGNRPNLILLDILMPDMDGFEAYEKLRDYEDANSISETPIVFLTAGDHKEYEIKGLELGALDFVKKPFEPNVLIHRIKNVLNHTRKIKTLSVAASTDKLTGLLNKVSTNEYLKKICNENDGALLVIDMDNFKLVNDLYGHEEGDRILVAFASILKHHFRSHDIVGRIGGDEFVAFLKDLKDREVLKRVALGLNTKLHDAALNILGNDMNIPLGVSVGAIIIRKGTDYSEAFKKADKSLYAVKQNGKHGCSVYIEEDSIVDFSKTEEKDIKKWDMILEERNVSNRALFLSQDSFSNVYRYMLRYVRRYDECAYKVLFTLVPHNGSIKEVEFNEITEYFGEILATTLRNSDIMMHGALNQFMLLLPMVSEDTIHSVIERIMDKWEETKYSEKISIQFETEPVM